MKWIMKRKRNYCSTCNNLTESDLCIYCASTTRDRSKICIIEDNYDLINVEETLNYKGLYHVLYGSLSPSRGISPNELMLKNLISRLAPENNQGVVVREIIIIKNSTVESEATANYITRLLKPLGVSVNKIEIESAAVFESETIH